MGEQDEGIKRLEEMFRKQEECEAKGHPFEQKVAVPYHGGGSQVLAECSGCGALYDRDPTAEELNAYSDVFKLEFTI